MKKQMGTINGLRYIIEDFRARFGVQAIMQINVHTPGNELTPALADYIADQFQAERYHVGLPDCESGCCRFRIEEQEVRIFYPLSTVQYVEQPETVYQPAE